MSSDTSLVHFAAELAALLVAASGLVLVVLRASLVARKAPARVALATGFAVTAGVAFAAGSLLVVGDPHRALSAGRLVGCALLVLGSVGWSAGARSAWSVRAGAAVEALAAVLGLLGGPPETVDGVLAGSCVLVAAGLVVASRGSIAARVAAGAAGTLLAVVLVLSVAISGVITSSVQHDELTRLAIRARTEAATVADTSTDALRNARFAAADLAGDLAARQPDPLIEVADAGGGAVPAAATAALLTRLVQLSAIYPVGGFAYLGPDGRVLAVTGPVTPATVTAVAGLPAVTASGCGTAGTGTVVVGGRAVWALGAFPECRTPSAAGTGPGRLGTVLSVTPLGGAFLAQRHRVDPTVSLALIGPAGTLASAGPQPGAALVADVAGGPTARSGTHEAGGRFVASVVVASANGGPLSVVTSSTATNLVSERNQLFRTAALIALGGTLLALLLASALGDRITAGVRRLTVVAGQIEQGNTSRRAGIGGSDEVGRLGAAFDAMVDSVENQTAALQQAADDETRLRDRLEAVVAGMGDALVAVEADGRVTAWNRAADELTGVPGLRALGRPVGEALRLVDDEGVDLGHRVVPPDAGRWAVTGEVRIPGRDPVPVGVSSGPLRGPTGLPVGSVLVIRDLRRERELDRMKSEFLSRIGHELRTPLTGVLGYADILVRRPVPAERAATMHHDILTAAKRLGRTVELLEFFATSAAGGAAPEPEELAVRPVLDATVTRWTTRLDAGHPVRRRVARDTPPVSADRRWLELALDELVDNAGKFSPDGGRIDLSAAPVEDNGRTWVDLSVADRGQGMTPAEQEAAFGDFVQGDPSDTRRFGGLGLGLAVVRQVAERLGGTVACRSSPGRGTTLTIRLPAATGSGTRAP